MRGADSLAGALAIPFLLPNGEPFPGRNLILLLTFCVIFGNAGSTGLTIARLSVGSELRTITLRKEKRDWRD